MSRFIIITFTFTHLADAFIQSNMLCIQHSGYTFFCQYVLVIILFIVIYYYYLLQLYANIIFD